MRSGVRASGAGSEDLEGNSRILSQDAVIGRGGGGFFLRLEILVPRFGSLDECLVISFFQSYPVAFLDSLSLSFTLLQY